MRRLILDERDGVFAQFLLRQGDGVVIVLFLLFGVGRLVAVDAEGRGDDLFLAFGQSLLLPIALAFHAALLRLSEFFSNGLTSMK